MMASRAALVDSAVAVRRLRVGMISENITVEKKKVLLVEDHPVFRAMLVQLIEKELGMTVCGQADNIQEAMTLIEQTKPDAAIVDLTLDGSSGLELIKDLKARHNPLPVLVLSMHEESLYAERVLRAGAKGYVSKTGSARRSGRSDPPGDERADLREQES